MLSQIDAVCNDVKIWPHAVLSGHAHNYQRFTRQHGKTQIPYIICGNGGHALAKLLRKAGSALRTPQLLDISGHADKVTLENYDDQDYGYVRVIVTAAQLRIEYHPASDGPSAKTPDDFVTVDLATRTLVHFTGCCVCGADSSAASPPPIFVQSDRDDGLPGRPVPGYLWPLRRIPPLQDGQISG